jgi:hypothetical protein
MMPYTHGVGTQALGFRLIDRLTGLGKAGLTPRLVRSIDGGPDVVAGAVVLDRGNGHYIAMLTQADRAGGFISFILSDPTCVPSERTILPFDAGGLGVAIGGTGSDLSATGPGIVVQPGVGVPLTVVPQVSLSEGGTASDLSGSGPGIVVQAGVGASLSVAAGLGVGIGGTGSNLSATGPGVLVQAGVGASLTVAAGLGVGIGGTGSNLSATGPGVLVQAGVGAVLSVAAQLPLGEGGSGSDLSATGPGVLVQAGVGSALTVVVPGGAGNVLTSVGGVWVSQAPAGGTAAGANTQVQYNALGLLQGDPSFTWDSPGQVLTIIGTINSSQGGKTSSITAAGWAAKFGDGANSVVICNGTQFAVDVTAGSVWTAGTVGNTYAWGAAVAAPATTPIGVLPLFVYGAGAATAVLATPDAWARVNVAGTDYRVPLYL